MPDINADVSSAKRIAIHECVENKDLNKCAALARIICVIKEYKNVTPSNVVATKNFSLNLGDFQFSYLKFKIVWKLGTGVGGGVGDPEDEETVGESVLDGMG